MAQDVAKRHEFERFAAAAHLLTREELVGLRPAHRGADPRRLRRCRRRDSGRGPFLKIELREHLPADGAESGIGARVARGEGAQLLEVKEAVEAVLSARCDAAWSTHLRAGAAHTVISTGSSFEGPRSFTECTPREVARSQLAIDDSIRAWS